MKFCPKCQTNKELDKFPKNKNSKDGLYCWCSECNNASSRKYAANNKNKVYKKNKEDKQRRAKQWCEFFVQHYGENPTCSICSKSLQYMPKDKTNSILAVNWDHRHEDHANGIRPSTWLHDHVCDEENKSIWLSFDFGILCNYCNGSLPTLHRLDWLEKAIEYTRISHGVGL